VSPIDGHHFKIISILNQRVNLPQIYLTAFHGPYPAHDRSGLCPVVSIRNLIHCPCFIVYLTMLSVAQIV
jgi:hypothetical protein